MVWGVIFSIAAGMAMSVQGVMNTRLGERIGTMEANALVQCTAAALSLIVLLFWRQGSFAALGETPKLYWFGGVLGLVITVTVLRSAIQAKLLGDQLGLHPLASLAAIYAGWTLGGVMGMLLFPILAICVKQALPGLELYRGE